MGREAGARTIVNIPWWRREHAARAFPARIRPFDIDKNVPQLTKQVLYLFTSRMHGIITRKTLGSFCLFLHKNKLKVAILNTFSIKVLFRFCPIYKVWMHQSSSNRLLVSFLFCELPVDVFKYCSSLFILTCFLLRMDHVDGINIKENSSWPVSWCQSLFRVFEMHMCSLIPI